MKARSRRIQAAMLEHASSQRAIAIELGLNEGTVSRILGGTYPIRSVRSERTQRAVLELVSAKTGIPVSELRSTRPRAPRREVVARAQ